MEARFADAYGVVRTLIDKSAVFSAEPLDGQSDYPRHGWVRCKVLAQKVLADGRAVAHVRSIWTEPDCGAIDFDVEEGLLSAAGQAIGLPTRGVPHVLVRATPPPSARKIRDTHLATTIQSRTVIPARFDDPDPGGRLAPT